MNISAIRNLNELQTFLIIRINIKSYQSTNKVVRYTFNSNSFSMLLHFSNVLNVASV